MRLVIVEDNRMILENLRLLLGGEPGVSVEGAFLCAEDALKELPTIAPEIMIVDLDLPGELQANIDASTHDGHISVGIPVLVEGTFSTSQIHGKMNGGGQTIVVRTGDGSIHLNKS